MKTTMYIPKTLHIGYQERKDTYTGKLAYVIYTDDKGVKRKEGSWKSWSREFLPDEQNVPTEGFVINKDVGGVRQSYGWDARLEKVRVYDPRGWEIEITIPNLLFILQECTSTKGKGLEGEFVYSWDGKDLVLLPISAQQYKDCVEFSQNQGKKVSKDEVKVGHWVKFKDDQEYIYLGRFECRQDKFDKASKKHVYFNPNLSDYNKYRYESGFTKVAVVYDQDDNYAEYVETFANSYHCNLIVGLEWIEEETGSARFYGKYGDNVYYFREDDYYSRHQGLLHLENRRTYNTLDDYMDDGKYYHYVYISRTERKLVQQVVPVFILANGKKTKEGV